MGCAGDSPDWIGDAAERLRVLAAELDWIIAEMEKTRAALAQSADGEADGGLQRLSEAVGSNAFAEPKVAQPQESCCVELF